MERFTIEEAIQRVKEVGQRLKSAKIHVRTEKVGEGENERLEPVLVRISSEADLTPEVLHPDHRDKGPIKRGEIRSYLTVDGKKLWFDARNGNLIGSPQPRWPSMERTEKGGKSK